MAQPSVSREPSMEEILASIRRIIESNDPDNGKIGSTTLPPVYDGDDDDADDDVHLTIEDEVYASTEILAANDPGPSPSLPTQRAVISQVEPERPAGKSISLADLAARVRSSSERAAENERYQQGEAPRAESPVMTSRMAELRSSAPPAEMPAAAMTPARVDAGQNEAPMVSETFVSEAVASEQVPTNQEIPSLPVSQEIEQTALVSVATGEQVARSFGELAEAIDGGQRRSLDEMAEEMLRPMLREWLDDNLPTLVERLVREEIERVARGPRR
ncbi:MAG: PopZ family protein [Allorhizobium sp.]